MARPSFARRATPARWCSRPNWASSSASGFPASIVAAAPAAIFGYTCVNDVTARDLMRLDPAFVHWTRAKSFDSFGVFGPVIATGLDPAGLRVRAVVAG
jgi:2-keto-4-pentenoate hydratase/2-oxohepta-3-ene-1,7-dioic acid hydratase in catechol pathway